MAEIQKQSIYSTIIIYLGFLLGAFNVIILFPKVFSEEQVGLIRTLLDASLFLGTLGLFASNIISYKFHPYYKNYLPDNKNDLPGLSLAFILVGLIIVLLLIYFGKPLIIRKFSANASLFVHYYYWLIPLTIFYAFMELWFTFSVNQLRSVFPNFVKEFAARLIITVFTILYFVNLVDFNQFITLYSSLYVILFLLLYFYVKKYTEIKFVFSISKVTKRLWKKIITYQSFVMGGLVFYIISQYIDTFFISGLVGLSGTAVFSIATFIATLLQVPQRAMTNISIPIIARAWKEKNYAKIKEVYSKSSINLLITALLLFVLIWSSIDNLYSILPPKYSEGKYVLLILCISKIIDLGTGLNNIVILTSNKWRFDFITGVILIFCVLFLNYFLVKAYGIMGSAFSNLISFTIYNAIRYFFLWIKFGFQPFTIYTFLIILLSIGIYFIQLLIPYCYNWFVDSAVRCIFIICIYFFILYRFKFSEDIQHILKKNIKRFIS